MPLEAPNLDDRRYADLIAEARSLIPRYAPEWTNFNDSDPGMTLIQLFAWLGETILYRLNRVPELNYINFLKLIGVEQNPAVPAKVELAFELSSPNLTTVIVPAGTRVGAAVQPPPPSAVAPSLLPPADEEPVVFETDEPLIAIGAQLKRVQVFDGVNDIDYTQRNEALGEPYYPFGRLARDGSALLFGFATDNPFPQVEINLTVRAYTDPNDLDAHACAVPNDWACATTPSNNLAPGQIRWEFWNGGDWRPLDVLKDETRALTQSGHVYFRGPKGIKKDKIGAAKDLELFWMRALLLNGQYERPPQIEALRTNTVRATAVQTVRDEVIGASNGLPKQSFQLRSFPVYAGPPRSVDDRLREAASRTRPPTESEQATLDQQTRLRELTKGFLLEVDEGQGPAPWEEVEDFFNSGSQDRHYTLQRTTGVVAFGDGAQGRIPVAGINNLIARYYRFGGGAKGNVGAGAASDLQTGVPGVQGVSNPWMAEGGADEEPVEDTKARAPKELKARDRAVTAQDFEFLARQTPGVRVRRAHALPLYHPSFPGVEVPGALTVMVAPESNDPKPMPSEATMQAVCAYLNARRLLTSEVIVAPPRYKKVKIEASVLARPTANLAEVKTKVEAALNNYLHPLTGGDDGQGWPLGGDVLYSEVFRQILNVDGVQTISDLRTVVDGERLGRCEDAAIPADFLVYSDGHTIDVEYATD